jgi:hypothetical protein
LLVVLFSFAGGRGDAAPLALTEAGTWNVGTFRKAQLTTGAGSNFVTTQTTAANKVRLTIKNTTMTGWNLTVRRADSLWAPSLHLMVRRTGAGTGLGTVTAGLAYQEITATDAVFFSGTGNKATIPLQFQLTGVSVVVGLGSFATTIVYTITEF